MDAINRFGMTLYSELLPNWLATATNKQHYIFPIVWDQLEKSGKFNLDWRLTKNPKVVKGKHLDFDFFFDVGPGMSGCDLPYDKFDYKFKDEGIDYFQFILSERVPNCLL